LTATIQSTARKTARTSASPVHHGLYHFTKKLVASKVHEQVKPITDFRESMVDLHAMWYDIEQHWQSFLSSVRKGREGHQAQAGMLADRLMNVAAALFTTAVCCAQRPGSKQMAVHEGGINALLTYGNCPACDAQGDIESVMPGIHGAKWKLRCPACHYSWLAEPEDRQS